MRVFEGKWWVADLPRRDRPSLVLTRRKTGQYGICLDDWDALIMLD
jgi:hypothetical protein